MHRAQVELARSFTVNPTTIKIVGVVRSGAADGVRGVVVGLVVVMVIWWW